ncbi:endonuclease [Periweissella cryptocerci]|uniref:Endonuclease n=1 Tax=Periweissella cryptocerci TaxID=2506420 RepID=A0A4V1AIG5_9LACO|nr:type I restriction endonuclease [Periweissella cryptocerci]QBO35425.1 endonuclease [Periweissella cryptocerci]
MEIQELKTKLGQLAVKVRDQQEKKIAEETTKTSLIMPFFSMLGYDVFDPDEFAPEIKAGRGIKRSERVDYAIYIDGQVKMLVEAKGLSEDLEKHDSQLFRYYTSTEAKFGILTNGRFYKFYTDLDETNKMDETPFLTIDVTNISDIQLTELIKFSKMAFDVDQIVSTASDLKYLDLTKRYLEKQFDSPSDEFIKFIINDYYHGVKTQGVIEQFKPIVQRAFKQLITGSVSQKLESALQSTKDEATEHEKPTIETTVDELEAYAIVKLMLNDVLEASRVFYRDNNSYFNVLIDDSNRNWLLRVYFRKNGNFIRINDGSAPEGGAKLPFKRPFDLHMYTDDVVAAAQKYV